MSQDQNGLIYLQRENVRLKNENGHLREYVERLHRAIQAMNQLQNYIDLIQPNLNLRKFLYDLLKTTLDAVDSENGSLLLQDEETKEIVFAEVVGEARDMLVGFRLDPGTGIVGESIRTRNALLIEDTQSSSSFSSIVDDVTGMQTSSLICIPLYTNDKTIGAIEAVNTRSGRPFGESDKEIIKLAGKLVSMAIVAAEKI
ncbi:MAG: GAF domain-containing protein [Anaerolineales bacterium]|nr:GAF domain-containing protein [Anaerolineales bacterium]